MNGVRTPRVLLAAISESVLQESSSIGESVPILRALLRDARVECGVPIPGDASVTTEQRKKRRREIVAALASELSKLAHAGPRFRFPGRILQLGNGYLGLLAAAARQRPAKSWPVVVSPKARSEHLEEAVRLAARAQLSDDPDVHAYLKFLRTMGPDEMVVEVLGIRGSLAVAVPEKCILARETEFAGVDGGTGAHADDDSAFRSMVDLALRRGVPVEVNTVKHETITRVLSGYMLATSGPAQLLRLAYDDGSEPEPFPVYCLEPFRGQASLTEMHVGLMSMRHLPLDGRVTVYWLRNRELDQTRGLSGVDADCTRRTERDLEALRRQTAGSNLRIYLYHTGLEPAVIGFYRAAVRSMRSHAGWLQVVPMFFRGVGEFEVAPPFPPNLQ